MTENEVAKKNLETLERFYRIAKSGSALHEVLSVYVTLEDLVEAIQALEEIQQYRAIGLTPQMVRDLIVSEKKAHRIALENADILDEYKAIGTIDEFKDLKEKAEPKEMDRYYCPICRHYFEDTDAYNYCPVCGQKMKSILE